MSMGQIDTMLHREGYSALRVDCGVLGETRVFGDINRQRNDSDYKEKLKLFELEMNQSWGPANSTKQTVNPLCESNTQTKRLSISPWYTRSSVYRPSDELPIIGAREAMRRSFKAVTQPSCDDWDGLDKKELDRPLGGPANEIAAMSLFDNLHVQKGILENMMVKLENSTFVASTMNNPHTGEPNYVERVGPIMGELNKRVQFGNDNELSWLLPEFHGAPTKALNRARLEMQPFNGTGRGHFEYTHYKELLPIACAAIIEVGVHPKVIQAFHDVAYFFGVCLRTNSFSCEDIARSTKAHREAVASIRDLGDETFSINDEPTLRTPKVEMLVHALEFLLRTGPIVNTSGGNTAKFETGHKFTKDVVQQGNMQIGQEHARGTLERIVAWAMWLAEFRDEAPSLCENETELPSVESMPNVDCDATARVVIATTSENIVQCVKGALKKIGSKLHVTPHHNIEDDVCKKVCKHAVSGNGMLEFVCADNGWRLSTFDDSFRDRDHCKLGALNAVRIEIYGASKEFHDDGIYLLMNFLCRLHPDGDTYTEGGRGVFLDKIKIFVVVLKCTRQDGNLGIVHHIPDISCESAIQSIAVLPIDELRLSCVYIVPLSQKKSFCVVPDSYTFECDARKAPINDTMSESH